MSKNPISDEEMDRLIKKVEGDENLIRDLISLRGGCSCHISPPCHACANPLTVDEAIDLGIYEDPPLLCSQLITSTEPPACATPRSDVTPETHAI